jgi:hypothetical protein
MTSEFDTGSLYNNESSFTVRPAECWVSECGAMVDREK